MAATCARSASPHCPANSAAPDKAPIDQYVGWYALAANRVLTVTRDGDRVLAQETGRPAFEVTARGADTFSAENDDLVFLRNKEAMVTRVLYQDSLTGPRIAPRIDAAKAKSTEAAFAQRVAAVSNRFTEQAPAPGGKDAVLRGIADLQNGTPNYDRMTPWLAAKIRRQASELHTMFASLGAVEQIFFRGVGPGGYDIYGVKFANGSAEIRLSLAPDGKASDVILRADGNDKAGDVTGCVNETDLKPRNDVPITMTLFNNTGNEIRIYNLDDRGNRASHGTIGDNMSSSILTHVDSPWIITDRSGQCLQIVLPGQRTRYHSVEASGATGVPLRTTSARNAPQAGSEEKSAPIHPRTRRGPAGLRAHDARSRGANTTATALRAGNRGQARQIAGAVIPGRLGARQRHLYGPLCQRHGGMADRPDKGRRDRAYRVGSAILVLPLPLGAASAQVSSPWVSPFDKGRRG